MFGIDFEICDLVHDVASSDVYPISAKYAPVMCSHAPHLRGRVGDSWADGPCLSTLLGICYLSIGKSQT